jgi:LytS/YehU family sensor histidine kinase
VTRQLTANFLFVEIIYFGVVAAVLAYDASRAAESARAEARKREVRAAQLEAQLVHARLDALRSQLNPHFLFNTLHAVSTLMARDVTAARTVLADLAALLRLALDRFGEPEVPLDDELDFLGHYLDIERTRFGDRLAVGFHVDVEVRDALVPPLVLQPLIENALKHAVTSRPGGGRVDVSARHDAADDALVLTVTDDGPGMPAQGPGRAGIGIKTTRDRLATLYGPRGSLGFRAAPGGGVEAEVRLPFHTAALQAPTP